MYALFTLSSNLPVLHFGHLLIFSDTSSISTSVFVLQLQTQRYTVKQR